MTGDLFTCDISNNAIDNLLFTEYGRSYVNELIIPELTFAVLSQMVFFEFLKLQLVLIDLII